VSDRRISPGEFVALAALLISLVAMAIDTMLPALAEIGADFSVANANDTQLVVSAVFVGLTIAQFIFGPLSDSWGRKPTVYLGLLVFCVGCLVSIFANSFIVMLVGRVLQGIGAAAPKIVTVAIVRDQFKGAAMARIMSIVFSVFIVVPALAPAIGQGILYFAHWRAIFIFLLVQGAIALLWFTFRQPETLLPAARVPLSLRRIGRAALETCTNRRAIGYTLAAGLVFGAFLGYLTSAQQIFQVQYEVGAWFPVYFGGLALSLGMATFLNSQMVLRFGMYRLALSALWALALLSSAFLVPAIATGGTPPLWAFMCFMAPAFFCTGILFGNFNAMAMEPMGHIAGTAAAVIASLSTLISLGLGVGIGRAFDGTILPLVIGMAALSVLSLPILYWVPRGK